MTVAFLERLHGAERERQPYSISAAGLIIMHAGTGKIWVQKDLKDKPLTGRKGGQFSTPFETMKQFENPQNTILRGLGEVCDDKAIPFLASRLVSMDPGFVTAQMPFRENGNVYLCNMGALMFRG